MQKSKQLNLALKIISESELESADRKISVDGKLIPARKIKIESSYGVGDVVCAKDTSQRWKTYTGTVDKISAGQVWVKHKDGKITKHVASDVGKDYLDINKNPYAKPKQVNEVEIIQVSKGDRLGKNNVLGKSILLRNDVKKLPNLCYGHEVWKKEFTDLNGEAVESFYLVGKDGKVHLTLDVERFGKTGSSGRQVDILAADKHNDVPAHKFYAWLIKTYNITLVSGSGQSIGGQLVWERLSKEPGINIHGWLKGKAVNLGPRLTPDNEDEVRNKYVGRNSGIEGDPDITGENAYRMLLVAHKK